MNEIISIWSFLIMLIVTILATIVASYYFLVIPRGKDWLKIVLGRYKLNKRIAEAGITNIYTSRDDFAKYRNAPKLIDYLKLAQKEIYISALWMAHGTEMEGIATEIARLTKPPKNLEITVAIISPDNPAIPALALYLNMNEIELKRRISSSLDKLIEEKNKLAPEEKARFIIKAYVAAPIASVIMLDPHYDYCRMQFEINPYKTARHYNFSFEFQGQESILFSLCSKAWIGLINDSEEYNP